MIVVIFNIILRTKLRLIYLKLFLKKGKVGIYIN